MRVAVCFALAVAVLPAAPARVAAQPCAYVANRGENTLAVVAVADADAVSATIPAGTEPIDVALSPDGRFVYVASDGGRPRHDGSVAVIDAAKILADPAGALLATIPTAERTNAIAVLPDGRRAYVTNSSANSVSVLDLTANVVLASISLAFPTNVAVTPNGSFAYVSYAGGLAVVDTASNTVSVAVPFSDLGPVAFTGDSAYALLGQRSGIHQSAVDVFQAETGMKIRSVAIPESVVDIAVLPGGPYAYVLSADPTSLTAPGILTVFDIVGLVADPSPLPVAVIATGAAPTALALSPDGSLAVVVNSCGDPASRCLSRGTVTIVDTLANTVAHTLEVGLFPAGVAVGLVSGGCGKMTPAPTTEGTSSPTATPTATDTPLPTAVPTLSPSPTMRPSATASPSPTPSRSANPSATPTPSPSVSASRSPTATPTSPPTAKPSTARTSTFTATASPTATRTRSATPSASPTNPPTPSPSAPASPTRTLTASHTPTRTHTASGAPPTTTPTPCVGACGGSSQVTIAQLLTMVNAALGSTNVSRCPEGDPDGNRSISVDELVQAVNNALGGCAGQLPSTATPTASATMRSTASVRPRTSTPTSTTTASRTASSTPTPTVTPTPTQTATATRTATPTAAGTEFRGSWLEVQPVVQFLGCSPSARTRVEATGTLPRQGCVYAATQNSGAVTFVPGCGGSQPISAGTAASATAATAFGSASIVDANCRADLRLILSVALGGAGTPNTVRHDYQYVFSPGCGPATGTCRVAVDSFWQRVR